MHTITFTVANEEDYQLLLLLAQRLGLPLNETNAAVSAPPSPVALPMVDVSKLSREELLAVIDKGGDGLSIPDPIAWQREQREDRPLPLRL